MTRHRVASTTEIPEEGGLRVTVKGTDIALFRAGERVYAVGDSCPHMGASLAEGYRDGKRVVCPWHGWAFDLDNGRSPFEPEECVPVFPVTVEGDDVFVEVEEEAGDAVSAGGEG